MSWTQLCTPHFNVPQARPQFTPIHHLEVRNPAGAQRHHTSYQGHPGQVDIHPRGKDTGVHPKHAAGPPAPQGCPPRCPVLLPLPLASPPPPVPTDCRATQHSAQARRPRWRPPRHRAAASPGPQAGARGEQPCRRWSTPTQAQPPQASGRPHRTNSYAAQPTVFSHQIPPRRDLGLGATMPAQMDSCASRPRRAAGFALTSLSTLGD